MHVKNEPVAFIERKMDLRGLKIGEDSDRGAFLTSLLLIALEQRVIIIVNLHGKRTSTKLRSSFLRFVVVIQRGGLVTHRKGLGLGAPKGKLEGDLENYCMSFS